MIGYSFIPLIQRLCLSPPFPPLLLHMTHFFSFLLHSGSFWRQVQQFSHNEDGNKRRDYPFQSWRMNLGKGTKKKSLWCERLIRNCSLPQTPAPVSPASPLEAGLQDESASQQDGVRLASAQASTRVCPSRPSSGRWFSKWTRACWVRPQQTRLLLLLHVVVTLWDCCSRWLGPVAAAPPPHGDSPGERNSGDPDERASAEGPSAGIIFRVTAVRASKWPAAEAVVH